LGHANAGCNASQLVCGRKAWMPPAGVEYQKKKLRKLVGMSRFASTSQVPAANDGSSIANGPTKVRYGVLAFAVLMAVILYLDRMAISVPVPAIAADLDLSTTAVGDSVAAFFWCYAFFQVPAGWLGDRWGGRRALTLYATVWSLAMVGLATADGMLALVAARGLLGIGQAGAYATTASFLRRWMPFSRRGLASSAVSLGGRAGGVLAPALTPFLMQLAAAWTGQAGRWRLPFVIYAAAGLIWAVAFWRWFRDAPALHRGVNAAEIALIEGHESVGSAPSTVGTMPLVAIASHRSLQLLGLIMFSVNVGWIFLATWLPTYLIEVHHCSEKQAGLYTSLTAAAGMAGCLAGGFATDFLVARLGLVWGRRIPGIISYGGAALGLLGVWAMNDVAAIVSLLVLSSFLGDFALGSIWATSQDIGGPFAGTVLGWSNMCGNIGAAVAISVIGRLVAHFGWPVTFILSSSAYVVGALGWLGVDPRAPLHPVHPPSE
ncbi:MAG TPA: MFS transporter, partial [Pirellulales bacterium]|nr:MFS transporter [Pirellulales bacterium]